MAGDIGVHERLVLGSADEEAGAETRVLHRYGPNVRIVEAGSAAEAEAPAPAPPDGLDPIGALGLAAFRLRQSPEYIEKKRNRPHEGKRWDAEGLLPPDPPPGLRHLTRATQIEGAAMAVAGTMSQRMMGSIAVGLVIVSGPGDLAFTAAERTQVVAEAQNGLSFFATAEPAAQITWTYDIRTPVITTQSQTGPGVDLEALWRNPAMVVVGNEIGQPFTGTWADVSAYANWLRTHYGTQYAFVAFLTKYPLGHFAYADLGGPRLVMQYSNDGWGPDDIDRLFAHETGHIFQAPDEYGQCSCGGEWGVFSQPNDNCEQCGSAPCIMKQSSWALCNWTTWHLGFPWPNSLPLNGDQTPHAPASCAFNNQLFVFWRANDESRSIFFTSSTDGLTWPASAKINASDYTPFGPAACVFNNSLYVFFRAADSNRMHYTASSNGTSWPGGTPINQSDQTPSTPAACAFNGKLYLFWQANDASNRIYYSASSDGQTWPSGQRLNGVDHTPSSPTCCVFNGELYVFWKSDDETNSISYSVSSDGRTFSNGQRINLVDYSPYPLSACVVGNKMYLYWRGEGSSHIYVSASSDGRNWPAGVKINPVDTAGSSPAAAAFNGNPYLFFKQDGSNQIRWTP